MRSLSYMGKNRIKYEIKPKIENKINPPKTSIMVFLRRLFLAISCSISELMSDKYLSKLFII